MKARGSRRTPERVSEDQEDSDAKCYRCCAAWSIAPSSCEHAPDARAYEHRGQNDRKRVLRSPDKEPESLLDIGGSTGVVARKVATSFTRNARATVLDPAPDELACAQDLETIASTAEAFDPLNRRWDLVLCCQTIDHCPQPINVMMTAAKCMAPGGLLWVDFVDVHDVSEDGEIPWKIDHPCGFTLPTAARAVEFAGLRSIVALRKDNHIGLICTKR